MSDMSGEFYFSDSDYAASSDYGETHEMDDVIEEEEEPTTSVTRASTRLISK